MITIAESGKTQVEPDHVWPDFANRPDQHPVIAEAVDLPAALHVEPRKLRLRLVKFVGHDGQADQRVRLQFLGHVIAILVQHDLAGRKGTDETYFHGPGAPKRMKC